MISFDDALLHAIRSFFRTVLNWDSPFFLLCDKCTVTSTALFVNIQYKSNFWVRIVHCINAVETSKATGRDSGTRSKYWTTSFLLILPNFFCLPSVNKSPSVVTSYLRNRNLVDYLLRRTFSCCWSSLWPWSLVVSLLPNIHGSKLTTTLETQFSCSRLVDPRPRNRPSDAPFLAALVSLSGTCRLLRRRFSKTPQTLVPTTPKSKSLVVVPCPSSYQAISPPTAW